MALACAAVPPASAHHSFAAAYNMENPIEIVGTIVNVRLTNPHSHFVLDVEGDDGEAARWKIEAGTPSGMIRNGYSSELIQQGDLVTIKGFRARDGSDNGMLTELITADGTVYGMFGPRQGPCSLLPAIRLSASFSRGALRSMGARSARKCISRIGAR